MYCSAQDAMSLNFDFLTKKKIKASNIIDCNIAHREQTPLILAIERTDQYLPLLRQKKIGIIANQTSIFPKKNEAFVHLVDYLLSQKIEICKIFSPEHGFRGIEEAGKRIKNGKDKITKLPIISMYGKNKKPTSAQLSDIDVLLFDIQDVGVRFYTYLSTLYYAMEAAAENNKKIIVLDRPNPNASYIDGPVLEKENRSFVGLVPVPVVYGMTIGEYAQMLNREKWLKNGVQADLTIIPMQGYTHQTAYRLPVKPSPNLPNQQSVKLYPSLCFFEGTTVSIGRGTSFPFQVYGSPYSKGNFQFTPHPNQGAKNPKNYGKINYGKDLRNYRATHHLNLSWLIETYKAHKKLNEPFWLENDFIDLLAGTKTLRQQIEQGWNETRIRKTWQKGLNKFKRIRRKYLLYK